MVAFYEYSMIIGHLNKRPLIYCEAVMPCVHCTQVPNPNSPNSPFGHKGRRGEVRDSSPMPCVTFAHLGATDGAIDGAIARFLQLGGRFRGGFPEMESASLEDGVVEDVEMFSGAGGVEDEEDVVGL